MALSADGEATHGIAPQILAKIRVREEHRFRERRPRSQQLHAEAREHMPHGVPLHWMSQWGSPYPIFAERASGARLTDVDGHSYVDFCLGDSACMFGHAHPAFTAGIAQAAELGASYMLPTRDAIAVTRELSWRFRVPFWQLATSATEANRFALRIARMFTGREKILVFNGKYHGSVDETQVELRDGRMAPQHGIIANGVDFDRTTRVIEFNDLDALETALAARDVAAVLTEPHMTNIGMVPAAPGFHDGLRRLTREAGTVLILDETHTICMGPSGAIGELGLEPDMVVLGKVLAGGIPSAVYGMSAAIAQSLESITRGPGINHYGFGGTLAANALTVRAIRVALDEIMTEATYRHMTTIAEALHDVIAAQIKRFSLPWHVSRMGARVEYLYQPSVPRNGGEAARARSDEIELLSHLYFANRGLLLTPFHNMALVSPSTTLADVRAYDSVFSDMLGEFTQSPVPHTNQHQDHDSHI
ncbi:transaminase [Streptomyces sp. AcH 505]|uniref:transaminase n=1 Tax=Streptomyces sp. AcH 505 TaxID=352211 RepID=UPI00099BB397